jgi:SAM-dependent methyltransferase
MNHEDHLALLGPGVEPAGGTWADIGSGTGAFTLALADLLGPGGRIVSVDRDEGALQAQAAALASRFPGVELRTLVADFRRPLALPRLDGIVMANSLHFVPRAEQVAVVRALASHLRAGGRFLVVEYDSDRGNPWVPHPFSYRSWVEIGGRAGLVRVRQAGRLPSRFLGAIYSAVAERAEGAGAATATGAGAERAEGAGAISERREV